MRVNDGYKADTTTVYVTVNPVPSVITGALSVGTGGYTVLADSASGGAWSNGSAGIASVGAGTGLVIAGATGTTTVTIRCLQAAVADNHRQCVCLCRADHLDSSQLNGTFGFTGDGAAAHRSQAQWPVRVSMWMPPAIFILPMTTTTASRKVSPAGIISTIAGTATGGCHSADGVAATASPLNVPFDVVTDGASNIYASDYLNNRIRKINSSGTISTVAGTGAPGLFRRRYGSHGGTDKYAHGHCPGRLRQPLHGRCRERPCAADKYNSGIITTIAGTGTAGSGGDVAPPR